MAQGVDTGGGGGEEGDGGGFRGEGERVKGSRRGECGWVGAWVTVRGSCCDGAGPLPATPCGATTQSVSSRVDPFEQHTPVRMLDRRTRGILWGESGAWMLNSYD
jgi:hypothetical protein